nr:FdhF/YdeP family oxidoreductase [Halomonas elongata]
MPNDGTLHEASRRKVPIMVFNPLRERALERFADPQNMIEMATYGSTRIASSYFQVKAGGDAAAIKGIMKSLLEMEESVGDVLDHDFINRHTVGFDELVDDLAATKWSDIEAVSGIGRSDLEMVAAAYAKSSATIVSYGMGVTQHNQGTANVRLICDLLMLRGNFGKPGAGICPLRGHSNVQGNRTVGITERPDASFLENLEHVFGFEAPKKQGHDAVQAMQSMVRRDSKALFCLGGNFAVALPDPAQSYQAMRALDLSVHVATKLNRSHLLVGKETYLFPCLGRTEQDIQRSGPQSVTVEDSMSMVHASAGKLQPASEHLKSEPAIVAGIAANALPESNVPWNDLVADYDNIRDLIEKTTPGFDDYNDRIRVPGGFRMPLPPTERKWETPSGKAEFYVFDGLRADKKVHGDDVLRLVTIRSHDQYNTTIYAMDDRYRGVFGRRDVLFMSKSDLQDRGLQQGDLVNIETVSDGEALHYDGLTAIEYSIAPGTIAAYYPEANRLVPLDYIDKDSGTPSYKSIPVRVRRAGESPA